MIDKRCQTCKWAEWEYCEGVGPGIRGFWGICGCQAEAEKETFDILEQNGITEEVWNSGEVGDTIECPVWEEVKEEEY